MRVDRMISQIDWETLRAQKAALIEISEGNMLLLGLVSLLDAVQDAAVSDHIATEETVFGSLEVD